MGIFLSKSVTQLPKGLKPRCFLIHGFNVWDNGTKTTDELKRVVEDLGFEPVQFDYGWIGLLGARCFSKNLAQVLASISRPGDIAIGHSNGCNIINQASHLGASFERVLYISPALDTRTTLASGVKLAFVLHTRHDWIVRLASWLPFHPWGRMGCKGFCGASSRYENLDCSNWSFGHSDYFKPHNLQRLEYHIMRCLDENGISDFYPGPKRLR